MLLARISVHSNPLGPPVRLWYWSVHTHKEFIVVKKFIKGGWVEGVI